MIENYGHGDSTHLDQTALGAINTGFKLEEMFISPDDATILKRLAEKVAVIASSEAMAEKRMHWQNINMLQETRPVILCDPENGWNEIITEKQMECSGLLARRWEMNLRKEIFWGEEMGDDKPVEPYFVVPYTVAPEKTALKAGTEPLKTIRPTCQNYVSQISTSTGKQLMAVWKLQKKCSNRFLKSEPKEYGGGHWV
jgi:hypothetical protein